MKQTNAQLQTALKASEARRVLAEKRLTIASEALRETRYSVDVIAAHRVRIALKRMANLRLRKASAQ